MIWGTPGCGICTFGGSWALASPAVAGIHTESRDTTSSNSASFAFMRSLLCGSTLVVSTADISNVTMCVNAYVGETVSDVRELNDRTPRKATCDQRAEPPPPVPLIQACGAGTRSPSQPRGRHERDRHDDGEHHGHRWTPVASRRATIFPRGPGRVC